MKYEIKLFNVLNEKQRGAIVKKTPDMKDIIGFSRTVCELPGNTNKDKFLDMARIYLFNEEYRDEWTHFIIMKV